MSFADPRSVPCPTCQASPNEPCRGAKDMPRNSHHRQRHDAAQASRDQQQADSDETRRAENNHNPLIEPWCQCRWESRTQIICDEHRRIGLKAIARLRAERADKP